MGIATEVLFCLRQTCSNVLGWHCPWQVPFSLLRSGVSMFTVHALWHSVCIKRLCFLIVSQFSSVLARFTSVPTTVLPTRCMRHWILCGLGALPWLDLCVRVDRAPVASFVFSFRQHVSQRWIALVGPRDCVGICFGCSMSWLVLCVCASCCQFTLMSSCNEITCCM